MNIGFDAKRFGFNFSGLGNYSRWLIENLASNFKNYSFFGYSPKTISNILPTKIINKYNNIFIKINNLPIPNSLWRSLLLQNHFPKDKINLYHGLSHELPLKSKIPYVLTVHDVIFCSHPHLYNKIDAYIYKLKLDYACKIANKIICLSQNTANELLKYFKVNEKKIEVVYQNCSDIFNAKYDTETLNFFLSKYNLKNNEFILNVSTIEHRKNQLLILKSLNNLNKKGIKLKLVIIGVKKNYYNILNEYIKKNNLEDQVLFIDKIIFNELPYFYQACKCLIYPSFYEGFGLPILEAIKSNTSVITSKNGCFKEVGGNYALYIDPNNELELTEKIEFIYSNNTNFIQTKNVNKKIIEEKFNNEKLIKQIDNIYKSII